VHKIIIPSSFLLDNIFKNPEAIGQIGKWATKINNFAIEFVGRNAIKSQALTDFLADWTPDTHNTAEVTEPIWTVHTDGAWGSAGAGIAAILTSPSGIKLRYVARLELMHKQQCRIRSNHTSSIKAPRTLSKASNHQNRLPDHLRPH
jgi:hypothetical protein